MVLSNSDGNAPTHALTVPDRPLGLGRTANYDVVAAAVAASGFELPQARSRKARDVIARIAVDCIHTAKGLHAVGRDGEPRSGWTSVSFSEEWWGRAQRDYPGAVSYNTVVPAVRAMAAAGIIAELQIGEQRGPNKPARADGKPGLQTRFLPSPDLRHVRLSETRHDVGGLVRLRDSAGAPQRVPVNRMLDRMLRFISSVNDAIGATQIALTAPRMRDNGDGTISFGVKGHTVWTDRRQVYRVFNGGFDRGGRYYGPWWQAVSSKDRAWYVIDGEPTVELDFETLHPRLLRAFLGAAASTGDEYRIRGYEDQRALCKVAYNALLNAGSRSSAVGAIAVHAQRLEDATFGIERPLSSIGRVQIEGCYVRLASDLVEAIKRTHPEIAHGFHYGLGLALQHADSEIATEVMRELTVKRGIITLPVHDSFIVAARHRAVLEEAMERALASGLAKLSRGAKSYVTSVGYRNCPLHEGGRAKRWQRRIP